jgi:hypothetical protein
MKTVKNIFSLGLAALFILVGTCLANDPPERIWLLEGSLQFDCYDFTWIGDQNGDGCDELLVCREPLIRSEGEINPKNRVELFLGSPNGMSTEAAYIFPARDSLESMGLQVAYLGALTAEGAHDFAILTAMYAPNQGNGTIIQYYEVNIYKGGLGRFDTVADYRFHRGGFFQMDRPCDVNGDGYNDLIIFHAAI